MVNKKIFDEFKKITNYDIGAFFIESRDFFDLEYIKIVNFFRGESDFLDQISIKILNGLLQDCSNISNLFIRNKKLMNNFQYWELLDNFEDIKTKLQTTVNISKYLRSSIIANKKRSGFVFEYDILPEQTLENISKNILSESDSENSWVDIAIENDLEEIDYDIVNSERIKLRKRIFQSNLVTSMIDNTIGERIYGKDIKKHISFNSDDLETLSYKDTVFQTVEILSKLERGDIPEFEQLGLDSQIYKGSNLSQLNYSSIVRELRNNFSTDDLFQDFEIKDFKIIDGDMFIEYKINTKYELVIIKNITI